jgi:hypothetical protein
MDIVSKLFGNESRIKLMRFLFLNDKKFYTVSELQNRTRLRARILKKEGEFLRKVGLIRIKKIFGGTSLKRQSKKSKKKSATFGITLNPLFPHALAFKNLFVATNPLSSDMILKRLNQNGRVKLIVASGIFLENPDNRLDLLVVGDKLDKQSIDRAMRSFEATLGRELRYTLLETPDFNYRLSVFDRLVRDVLDYPHKKILNKIGL